MPILSEESFYKHSEILQPCLESWYRTLPQPTWQQRTTSNSCLCLNPCNQHSVIKVHNNCSYLNVHHGMVVVGKDLDLLVWRNKHWKKYLTIHKLWNTKSNHKWQKSKPWWKIDHITYVTSGSSDPEPLTPAHLLYGRRYTMSYQDIIDTHTANLAFSVFTGLMKRARDQMNLIDRFWKKWKHEYLTALRVNHQTTTNNYQTIVIGDVVQIHDKNHVVSGNWQ